MYKVHYDKETGEILGFYDNTGMIEYPDGIPEPNIEITAEQHAEAFETGKIAKIVEREFVIEDIPEPTLEELQEQWRTALKTQYDADRINLGTLIMMADDEEEEAELQAKKNSLKEKYEAGLAKVDKGINPFK